MLVVSLLALTACDDLIKSNSGLVSAPDALLQECEKPVLLPERALTQYEVETLWAGDRVNLVDCSETKNGLIDFYAVRDAT